MDFSFENNRAPKKGLVLVSDPFSKDGYFSRSIVFLCEHNEEGSFGFVINNYLDLKLSEIAEGLPEFDTKVSIGGPVQTESIYFIHTLGEQLEGSVKVTNEIYIGGNFDTLSEMINTGKIDTSQVRFFLGYSGWDSGQLEEEIKQNSWIVAQVNSPLEIMDFTVENIWQRFMKREGKKFDILSKAPIEFYDN